KLAPGTMAPDFTLADLTGKQRSLSSFKGKVVYIDFWATTCGPCVQEIPMMKKLQADFANEEIVFLQVSLGDGEQRWKDVLKQKGLKGVHLLARGIEQKQIESSYRIQGIPVYVLVDRDGKIITANAPRPSSSAEIA